MRIGVFGGSFDPVHLGHLILAEQCREQAKLDRVLFIPAPRPPHKQNGTMAEFSDRVAMLQLAITGHAPFAIDTCEQDRAGLSYTVDTLRFLQKRDAGNEWYLILGGDSVRDLETWREPCEIAKLCQLLIVQRPGAVVESVPDYFRQQVVDSPLIDISSTDIRQRCKAGRTIRFMVPKNVEEYVVTQKLYG